MRVNPSISGFARFVLLLVALALVPVPIGAQEELRGRIVQAEEGVSGVEVELHRVTRDTAGVVARTRSGANGEFRVALPPRDTLGFTVYFATATHLGARYFGAPLHPNDTWDDYAITVYDTVSVTPGDAAVRVQRRDLILIPESGGAWEVNELFRVVNHAQRTLIGAEGKAIWEFEVPAQATDFELGEGEFGGADLVRMGNRVLLTAPLVPGPRELYVRYRIPRSADPELAVPIATATDVFNVLVQQPAPAVTVAGLSPSDPLDVEGRRFATYIGAHLEPGAAIALSWDSTGPPVDPRTAALATVGAFLLLGAAVAVRQRRGGGSGAGGGGGGGIPVSAVVREPEPTTVPEP